jgi:hypothetical protein
MEEMNQFGLQYIYTWKCHKKTPCIVILNKQKCHAFYKNKKQKGRAGPALEIGTSGKGDNLGKGCRRVNMIKKYCVHKYINGK